MGAAMSTLSTGRPWNNGRLLFGAAFLIVGSLVLIDISIVSSVSALAIGGAAILAGLAAIFQRATTRSLASLLWRLALGILYISFGVVLLCRPEFQAAFLKFALATALVGSGLLRVGLGLSRKAYRWLLASGLIGIAGGAAIFLEKPFAEVRFVAAVLGFDLLIHGLVWIAIGLRGEQASRAA